MKADSNGIAVVTGGGSGIGKACARALSELGYRVVIVGRTTGKLQRTAVELGERVDVVQADVGDVEHVDRAVRTIANYDSRVSVLVNNAGFVQGISVDTPLREAEERWEREIASNLKGAFLMSIGLAPQLARPGGRIINIGSIAAFTGGSQGGVLGYGAAKAGIHGLTCALARELSSEGVTVNTVSPGLIDKTDFFGAPLNQDQLDKRVQQIPLGRAGVPEDVAAVVAFLGSENASYITGEIIHVNGGWMFGH